MNGKDNLRSIDDIKNSLEEKINNIEEIYDNSNKYWERLKERIGYKE